MSWNFDFSIEKLSAPIERLKLDQRTINLLRRVHLQTISQIIAAGKHDIFLIRNISHLTVDRVYRAIADYLEVSEDVLTGDEIQQIASMVPEGPRRPLSRPVAVLNLSNTVFLLLKNADVLEIEQLIKFRATHYAGHSQFGIREAQEIDRALSSYLKFLDETEIDEIDQSDTLSRTPELGAVLDSLWLDERAWSVIEHRAIRLSTLEDIGVEFGVSKERVRQIIKRTNKKIQRKLGFLLPYCDYFDKRSELIRQKINTETLAWSALVDEFKRQLSDSDLTATKEDLEQLIAIIRLLVISNKLWVQDTFEVKRKDLTFLVCLVEPPVKKYKPVRQFIGRMKKTGYKELVYMVLAKADRPLQWKEIEERARKLNKKERFESRSLYAVLISHKNLFISDGQGTYKLVEWTEGEQ